MAALLGLGLMSGMGTADEVPAAAGTPSVGAAAPASGGTAWPVVGARVTSGFGARWGTVHGGMDFAAPIGTPIRAVADGTVIEAEPASGFGLWVRIRHDRDGVVTVYGHMQTITTRVGARVRAGQQIATVGNRGQSTGPHLHLEVWPGGDRNRRVDPARWLADNRATPLAR